MIVHRTQLAFSLFVIVSHCSEILASESIHRKHSGRSIALRSVSECRAVADIFGGINLGEGHVLPSDKIDGSNLEICSETADNKTCCTKQMEERLLDLAVGQTQNLISRSSSNLKSRLASDAKLYREQFNDLLSSTENNTKYMLTSTFNIPAQSANGSVEKLFSELATFVRFEDEINVRQSINHFFDVLFPEVVSLATDDTGVATAMTEEYKECLTTNRKEFTPTPFGEVSKRLVQETAKSFELARVLLDAFDLAAEVINITTSMAYERYCSEALTRLAFCSKCSGHTELPCKNFCLNIARGCMAHVTEINSYWNLFIAAVEKVVTSMHGPHDFQDTLITFHSKVYESFIYYIDNAHKYPLQMVSKCGHPGNGMTTGVPTADSSELTTTERSQRLLTLPSGLQMKFSFDMAVRNLASSKGFFNGLPDVICDAENQTAPDNNMCWNGTSISRYTRPVPAQALISQVKENPEFKVPSALVPDVDRIISRLNKVTKELHSRVVPRHLAMQADSTEQRSDFDRYSNFGSGDESGFLEESGFSGSGEQITSVAPEGNYVEETITDTTDFDFVSKSTYSATHPTPSPYRTSPKSTTTTTATTTTTTVSARGKDPPVARASMTSPAAFLVLLVVAVQRLIEA